MAYSTSTFMPHTQAGMNTKNTNTPVPYTVRLKVDSKGREHWRAFVPSRRGHAWIELRDLPSDQELRKQLFDPDFLPEWKVLWFQDAYENFREAERHRKNARSGFADDSELFDVERTNEQMRRQVTEISEEYSPSPEEVLVSRESQLATARRVAEILLPLTEQQRFYVTLSLGDGHSYADIARMESPDADEHLIAKKADAIRKCVDRATKRILKISGSTRPVPGSGEDV